MTLPTNDLLATDNRILNRTPFRRKFRAIAASFSGGGFCDRVEGEITDFVYAYATVAGELIDGARSFVHDHL